jgi:hypothetical protein
MKKLVSSLLGAMALCACPQPIQKCEPIVIVPDSGMEVVDAGRAGRDFVEVVNMSDIPLQVVRKQDSYPLAVQPLAAIQFQVGDKLIIFRDDGTAGDKIPGDKIFRDDGTAGDSQLVFRDDLARVIIFRDDGTAGDKIPGDRLATVVVHSDPSKPVRLSAMPVNPADSDAEMARKSLEASGLALSLGIDTDGDCKSDVGAKKGQDADVLLALTETSAMCATPTPSMHKCAAGKHWPKATILARKNGEGVEIASWSWGATQSGSVGKGTLAIQEEIPNVYVLNVRTKRIAENVSLGTVNWATNLMPLQVTQLPPSAAYHAINTKGAGASTAGRMLNVGGQMVPLKLIPVRGPPCRPPHQCDDDITKGYLKTSYNELHFSKRNILVVLDDESATGVRLFDDETAASEKTTPPYVFPIVTGAAKARSTFCAGGIDLCFTPKGVSADVASEDLSASIVRPSRFFTLPMAGQFGFKLSEYPLDAAGKIENYFGPTPVGSEPQASIVVVAPQKADPAAPTDAIGKIAVILGAKSKNYVGHVTLIKQ